MKIIFTYLILASVNLFTFFNQKKFTSISVCTILNSFCSTDLTDTISGLKLDSVMDIHYGKGTGISTDVLYHGNPCPPDDDAPPTTCTDGYDAMTYDVYYPDSLNNKMINYETCGFPAIIMFHGGSFDECSEKGHPGIKYVCIQMAKRGFIVFNVEYRRGVLLDGSPPINPAFPFRNVSAQQVLAVYRGSQDVRGAVRSIIHRQQTNTNGGRFEIDDTQLFLGGISAGSLIAMNAAYYERQSQIDSAWPGASSALGDIDQDYYVGDTNINFLPVIKGVVDMWGALAVHRSLYNSPETQFGGIANTPPIIAFQGDDDQIFPYFRTKLFFSTDSSEDDQINYNIERHCLVTASKYQMDDDDPNVRNDACAFGAEGIYRIFKNYLHKPVEIYLDCTMQHGLDDDCGTCVFDSDFGTGAHTQNEVYYYMAARTTTYFIAILHNKVTALDRSRFVECINTRIKCDTADSSPCSYDYEDEADYTCKDFGDNL